MKSKLFEEKPKTARTSTERWVRVMPDKGEGYLLYDALEDLPIGRILVDENNYWIYEGSILNIDEQEDVAGFITGNQVEMKQLLTSLETN